MESIGPYQVLGKLGEGGMASVYRVRDPHVEREVALKLIRFDSSESLTAHERFLREAEVLARVAHPNVVRVHRLERAPGAAYLVQEIVPGSSLEDLLRAGPFEPRRAAEVLRDLSDAVAAVHREGILHRDLKPANVMIRPEGAPVLLDFGVARDLNAETLTRTGALVGTPAYMAPEQANAEREALSPRTDVYGLGAVLYELLAGRAPYEGSPAEILTGILRRPPASLASLDVEVPPALSAIVDLAMAKEPEQRYASAEELREDLDAFLAGRPPRALADAPRGRGPAVAACMFAAILLGVGLWALPSDSSPAESPPATPEADLSAKASATPDLRLWRLRLGQELSYDLEFEERGGIAHTYLASRLDLRVGALEGDLARLDLEMRSLQAGFRVLGGGEVPHDLHTSPADPSLFSDDVSRRLSAILDRVRSPIVARVDLRSGAVLEVKGFDAIQAALKEPEQQAALEAIERSVPAPGDGRFRLNLAATLGASLSDPYMQRAMQALIYPRPGEGASWQRAQQSRETYFPRRELPQPLLVFHLNRHQGPTELDGKLSFQAGSLAQAQLSQTQPNAAGLPTTWLRWSLRRAAE